MALGSTQTLTEMNTRTLTGGKDRPARKAEKLTTICEPAVYMMCELRRLTTVWAFMVCDRDSFVFFLNICIVFKSRRIRWTGHVARMKENRNAYRKFVGKPDGKRPLGRPLT
jgi:hypothetical protein